MNGLFKSRHYWGGKKMARKRHAELMVVEIWWTISVSFLPCSSDQPQLFPWIFCAQPIFLLSVCITRSRFCSTKLLTWFIIIQIGHTRSIFCVNPNDTQLNFENSFISPTSLSTLFSTPFLHLSRVHHTMTPAREMQLPIFDTLKKMKFEWQDKT